MSRPWTNHEVGRLRALYGTAPVSSVAAEIGRSRNSVAVKAYSLGITKPQGGTARQLAYAKRFGLSERVAMKLRPAYMDQLDRCPTDCARRILLGVSEKFPARRERRTTARRAA